MKKRMNKIISLITKNKRKVVLLTIMFLMIFTSAFIYINLTNPTKINSIIASVINKGAPANKAFDDEIFYKAVVDAYNKKNKTSLPYTTNLTDEQLSTITSISYDGLFKPSNEKITSAKGLGKLTNLTYLRLYYNNLSSIDVSKNTALTTLDLDVNNISEIDLSNNTSLTYLSLYSNNLSSIDVSKNTALTTLDLGYNNLSEIDLSNNTALTTLDLGYNNLSEIDLSNNTALKTLYLYSNNLNNIDLSNNTALKTLYLSYNNLSEIDLSKNTSLTSLHLGGNNLNSINLSKNTSLISLDLDVNNISEIDLSKNTSLTSLQLRLNNLSSIDLSNNTALTSLDLRDNNISEIDLSKNTALKRLELYNNPLSLGEYRLIKGTVVEGNSVGNIKLPEQFPITYEIEDGDIASYEDGTIKGLKSGTTSLKATLKGIKSSSLSNSEDLVVEGTIKVFDIKSDKYEINKEDKYIYTKNDTDSSMIMKNITVENGTGKIENNIFKVMDGDVVVEKYKIVSVLSSKYDMSKEYIYLRTDTFDKTKINCINCTLEVNDNTLNIKYNDETLESYKLLSYSSTAYDLSKGYIYVGTNSFSLSNIKLVNLTTVVNDNTLEIKYGNTIMESYKIVSVSSSKYDLSKDNIRIGKDETFDLDNIKVTNAAKEYSNGKLYIKYGNEVIKTYTVSSRLKGDINNDDKITIIDVSMLYRHIKKRSTITDQETLLISDINNDGKITIMDVSLLYRYVKGKINEL